MDLQKVEELLSPSTRRSLPIWRYDDAWLAGGTWLFSEQQPFLRRLVDLGSLAWCPIVMDESGLSLSATCTIAQLDRFDFPACWIAAPLVGLCCRALLGSFKIWNVATVGGNVCLALPAAPIVALAAALDGVVTLWMPDGGERQVPVLEFVLGPQKTALRFGELLRSISIPAVALKRRTAFRRISLSPDGRSGALLIGTLGTEGGFALTVTASVPRPVRLSFPSLPSSGSLAEAITTGIPGTLYYDDVHGAPEWRRHVTFVLAEDIRTELEGGIGRCG